MGIILLVIVTIIIAIIFSRASLGLGIYILFWVAFIVFWELLSQAYPSLYIPMFNELILITVAVLGWIIGTQLIWSNKNCNRGLFTNLDLNLTSSK